jgi:hypothetical protein
MKRVGGAKGRAKVTKAKVIKAKATANAKGAHAKKKPTVRVQNIRNANGIGLAAKQLNRVPPENPLYDGGNKPNLEILHDDAGRRYSWNPTLETAEWLDPEETEDIAGAGAASAAGAELEILQNDDGRRYSWNPKLQTAEWLDDEKKKIITIVP